MCHDSYCALSATSVHDATAQAILLSLQLAAPQQQSAPDYISVIAFMRKLSEQGGVGLAVLEWWDRAKVKDGSRKMTSLG